MFGGTHVGPSSLNLEGLSKIPGKGHQVNRVKDEKEEEKVRERLGSEMLASLKSHLGTG